MRLRGVFASHQTTRLHSRIATMRVAIECRFCIAAEATFQSHTYRMTWRSPDMLFVGPLTQELPSDCLSWFRPRVSCVVPQGWLRSWTEPLPSVVEVSKSPPVGMSSGWDICVISESEIEDRTLVKWREKARCLIVTKGSEGAVLYTDEQDEPSSRAIVRRIR